MSPEYEFLIGLLPKLSIATVLFVISLTWK